MSNTKTRFAFTFVWLTVVLATITIRFPDFWDGGPSADTQSASTTTAPGPVFPDVRPEGSTGQTDAPPLALTANPPTTDRSGAPRSTRRSVASGSSRTESVASGSSRTDSTAATSTPTLATTADGSRTVEPPLADRLVLAAQTATAAGEHATAAQILGRLKQERPLTLDESKWLAGQHDAAGNEAEALVAYYDVASRTGDDPATWERIGDLEMESGKPKLAAAAYSRLDPTRRSSAAWVKVARAAAADGQDTTALDAYDSALAGAPVDGDAISLEAARYAASIQQHGRALEFYTRRGASGRGAAGLHLEMAQAALAAGRPDEALRWTSAATAAGDSSTDIRYARAQALHMTGQPGAAAAMLRELLAESPDDPRFVVWLARTSQAQGRHLEAYELYGDALTGHPAPADLLISRGDVAAERGDIGRARGEYARAQEAGADSQVVSERIDRLDLTPQLALPFEHLRDSNDVELTAQTARLDLWKGGPFRLAARFLAGNVQQQSTRFNARSGAVDIDDWFVTPRLSIAASAGYAEVGSHVMPAWNASARYTWRSGGSFAVQSTRQTPWSGDPSRDMMRFNRIHDLAAVGPQFEATTIGARVNLPVGQRQEFRADVTRRDYSDGNASSDAFVQFQQVLVTNRSAWIAVQPNVYVEQWREANPAYFSPETHVTAGLTLRAIGRRGIFDFDSGLTPQVLSSNGKMGSGMNLTAGVRARIGGGSVGANVMWFDDRRYAYNLRRIVADVRIPLGK